MKAMEELHAEDKLKVRSYLYVVPGEELDDLMPWSEAVQAECSN